MIRKTLAVALTLAVLATSALAENVKLGTGAGASITSGENHTAIGYAALNKMVVNSNGVAIGAWAAENNIAGGIVAVGMRALRNNTSGWINLGIGIEAAYNNLTGGNLTVVGMGAGYSNVSGNNHSMFGHDAGKLISSNNNLATFGKNSGYGVYGPDNAVFGTFAVGVAASRPSSRNSFFGGYSGYNLNGDNSTGVGFEAGYSAGSRSVYLGNQAGRNSDRSDVLHIANNASWSLIFGDFVTREVIIGGGSGTVQASAFNVTSNRDLKRDIRALAVSRIDRLRPVSFVWRDGGRTDVGFIAQEVAEAMPEAVTNNAVNMVPLVAELVAEVKALRARVAVLEGNAP